MRSRENKSRTVWARCAAGSTVGAGLVGTVWCSHILWSFFTFSFDPYQPDRLGAWALAFAFSGLFFQILDRRTQPTEKEQNK